MDFTTKLLSWKMGLKWSFLTASGLGINLAKEILPVLVGLGAYLQLGGVLLLRTCLVGSIL